MAAGSADEDAPALVASNNRFRRLVLDRVELGGGEAKVAAAACAALESGDADSAELAAEALVERQELIRDPLGQLLLGLDLDGQLGLDLGRGLVDQPLQAGDVGVEVVAAGKECLAA